jgi:hypothetical protein
LEKTVTPEEVWRRKSDEELVAASLQLNDFTNDGRRVILAELERRRESGLMSQPVSEEAVAETKDPSGATDTVGGLNGVRRLRHGYVSLPMTYWLWGVVASLFLFVVTAFAEAAGAAIPALLLGLLGIVYYVFISVAIWRSAGRYRGKSVWAHLARISVAVGAARVIVTILFEFFGS